MDRTGEIIGSYMMEYMGYSYEEVLALDNSMAQNYRGTDIANALQWYATYLKEDRGIAIIGKIS